MSQSVQPVLEAASESSVARRSIRDPGDYPIREYVGAMSAELARLARGEGDAWLANALDIAVELASRAPPSPQGESQS